MFLLFKSILCSMLENKRYLWFLRTWWYWNWSQRYVHGFMDASGLEYCWEPEVGSEIKILPLVKLFFFFNLLYFLLSTHPNCSSYDGRSYFVHWALLRKDTLLIFLAYLLEFTLPSRLYCFSPEKNFETDTTLWPKRLREIIFPLQDFSQSNTVVQHSMYF